MIDMTGQVDVLSAISDVISWLGTIIWTAFESVAGFIYDFLPDADSSMMGTIRSWEYILKGTDLDFNLYYFLDMSSLWWFLATWATVVVAALVIMAVRFVLDVVHKILDSIPIIG